MPNFPPVPPEIKGVAHFLKVAEEHENRNLVVSYWARMHACQVIMKMVPGKKSPEVSALLMAIIEWLEQTKKESHDTEGIGDETTANALIENYALQLFTFADAQDRECNFTKNTIKAFYTAGILMDILEQFGPLSDDIMAKRKYAKWKAAYIHNCLKVGDIPTSGGPDEHLNNVVHKDDLVDDDDEENADASKPDESKPQNSFDNPPTPNYMDTPVAPAPAPSPSTPIYPPPFVPTPTPFVPTPTPAPATPSTPSSGGATVGPDAIQKAQKHCKYAASALNYDDVKTAVDNLTKALNLLHTGQE